jgi:hypothetical protein
LAAAQAAVDADKNDANIQRLLAARRGLAWAETFANFGRGTLIGFVPSELYGQVKYETARPNVGLAEGERGQLDKLINPPPPKRRR